MKSRRNWIAVFAPALVAAVVIWILRGQMPSRLRPSITPGTSFNKTPTGSPSQTAAATVQLPGSPVTGLEAAFQTPISFWGKVVDQNGDAIDGAAVSISVNDKGLSGTTYAKTTDNSGLFSITGVNGLGISVAVSKTGYYRDKGSSKIYGYVTGTTRSGPLPIAAAPAIFTLRKPGRVVPLVVKGIRVTRLEDNTPVSVSLLSGQVVQPAQGDVTLQLSADNGPEQKPGYHPYDWRFQITVSNGGGLIERKDESDFVAPSEGYTASDQLAFSKDAARWTSQTSKEYFIRLGNGSFGRLKVEINSGPNRFALVTSCINPIPGDTSVEAAPKK
jgi:hypothetical protein